MEITMDKIVKPFAMVALALISAVGLSAQEPVANQKRVEFGLRFMPTMSNFEMRNSAGATVTGEVTLGYGIGALLGFNFSDQVGIQGEAIYSSISQRHREDDIERKIILKYINIPLLLALNTGKTKPVNLNIVGGPQIGINVGSDLLVSGSFDSSDVTPVLSIKKGDLGLAYGVGVDFGLNKTYTTRLGLGYRGVVGLFDISNTSTSITTKSYYILDRAHMKSHSAYIGLSFLF